MQKKKFSLTQLIFMALMAAVMCIAGPLAVPIGPVPITLTNLVIYIAVGVLGTAQGTISYCLYLLLGMVGLPVFSGYAGGIAMALIGGIVMEVSHRKLIPTLIGWFIGTAVDYLLGTLWFMYIMHTTFMQTMAACVFPFIIGDCIKLIAGVMLGRQLHKILVHAGFIKTAVA